MLEILVHVNQQSLLKYYQLFELKLPIKQIQRLDQSALPQNWNTDPAPKETATIGDQWLLNTSKLAIALPSCIVPIENNYLINIHHADFQKIIQQAEQIPFEFDSRLKP